METRRGPGTPTFTGDRDSQLQARRAIDDDAGIQDHAEPALLEAAEVLDKDTSGWIDQRGWGIQTGPSRCRLRFMTGAKIPVGPPSR